MNLKHIPATCAIGVFKDKSGIRHTALIVDYSLKAPAPRHEDRWVEIDSAGSYTFSPPVQLFLLGEGEPSGIRVMPLGAIITHRPDGKVIRRGGVPDLAFDAVNGGAHGAPA